MFMSVVGAIMGLILPVMGGLREVVTLKDWSIKDWS